MRREQQLALDHEMLRPQGKKSLRDVAEVRRGFLDISAEIVEAARGFGANLPRLPVDGYLAAEIGGEGDTLRRNRARHRGCKRLLRRVERQGITRAQSRHRIEKQ